MEIYSCSECGKEGVLEADYFEEGCSEITEELVLLNNYDSDPVVIDPDRGIILPPHFLGCFCEECWTKSNPDDNSEEN